MVSVKLEQGCRKDSQSILKTQNKSWATNSIEITNTCTLRERTVRTDVTSLDDEVFTSKRPSMRPNLSRMSNWPEMDTGGQVVLYFGCQSTLSQFFMA